MSFDPLRILAAGLCGDARIRLEEGPWWAFHPATNTILVPREERRGVDDRATAGLIAHEVGHVWLSRYSAYPLASDALPRCPAHLFLNSIEDGRVETWMRRRYPGIVPWLAAVRESDDAVPRTPFLQLLIGCAREGTEPSAAPDPSFLPQVQAALAATRMGREAYRLDFLPSITVRAPVDAYRLYDAEVASDDEADDPRSPSEAWVRVLAHRALGLAMRVLLPHASELYAEEVATVAWALGTANLEGRAMPPGPRNPLSLVRTAFLLRGDRSLESSDAHRELAKRIVREAYERFAHTIRAPRKLGMGVTDIPVRGLSPGSTASRSPQSLDEPVRRVPYATLLDRTASLREKLRGTLLPAFPPSGTTSRGAARHGSRVSLRDAFAADASPPSADRVFSRPNRPSLPRPALALLIDTSGSMFGTKLENALLAAVALAEVFHELDLPFCVAGFQDELLPVAPPGSPWSDQARERLVDLQLEAAGCHEGGHNVPEHNDDGPCLLEMAALLRALPADEHWLIVIGDGCPSGRRSDEDDLSRAVEELGQGRSGVRVIGIGVGEDTEQMRAFYPACVAGVPVDELPAAVVEVVGR